MSGRERAKGAFAAAQVAHELEVLLRSLAERLVRGETPDRMTAAFIEAARDRLNFLTTLATTEPTER